MKTSDPTARVLEDLQALSEVSALYRPLMPEIPPAVEVDEASSELRTRYRLSFKRYLDSVDAWNGLARRLHPEPITQD
jgi:hypothetical protein